MRRYWRGLDEDVGSDWWSSALICLGEAPARPENLNETTDVGESQRFARPMRVPSRGSAESLVSGSSRNGPHYALPHATQYTAAPTSLDATGVCLRETAATSLSGLIGLRPPEHSVDARGSADRTSTPFVVCRNVRKSYASGEILRGLDFSVDRGEVLVIMGMSGSGKSTLLRLINHLEGVDGGEIEVDGKYVGYVRSNGVLRPVRNLAKARADARIGMVFQQFNLFEHFTAIENVVEAPVHVYGMDRREADELGRHLLASVGLSTHADHLPHHLSGGQQQRVAIARALAISPRLMLFDEPTSALDPQLVGEVLGVIRQLADAGMTMIVVTHEVGFARDVADRIIFIDNGQIVEQGKPQDVLDNPQHERTKRFLRVVQKEAEAVI